MKLPYRMKAYVTQEKIEKYLISLTHAKGKAKAKYFRNLGFNETNIDLFAEALVKIAHDNDVVGTPRKNITNGILYGKSYEIKGLIIGPNGRGIIKTGWTIPTNKRKPHLATAMPT